MASLALFRSMLTNPEAASAASAGIARYQAQIAQAIPAADADLRAAIISAITLGITVSRHLIRSDELATADPAHVIGLLRPCVLSLAARPEPPGRLRISERSCRKAANLGRGMDRSREEVIPPRKPPPQSFPFPRRESVKISGSARVFWRPSATPPSLSHSPPLQPPEGKACVKPGPFGPRKVNPVRTPAGVRTVPARLGRAAATSRAS